MTLAPHTVAPDASAAATAVHMRELGVRHLPVVDRAVVRGVVDQRDLLLAQALEGPALTVREVMELEPVVVREESRLTEAAYALARRDAGCAVVVDGESVTGLLSAQDALRALAQIVDRHESRAAKRHAQPSAAEVRATIMREHRAIGRLLDRLERQARDVRARQSFGPAEVGPVRELLRRLRDRLAAHFELEEALLAPALERSDAAWGQLRADRMREDHGEQQRLLERVCSDAAAAGASAAPIVALALKLVTLIRDDMLAEEVALLGPEVLRDDPLEVEMETG